MYRWLKDPAFTVELRKVDGESLKRLGRRLLALADQAAKALEDCLAPEQPAGVRLRVAQIVCERGPALSELTAVVERLEALEASYGQKR